MPTDARILLVEDNADLAFGLQTNLDVEGYTVRVAKSGPEGLQAVRDFRPDLVVLDLMLPDMDGIEVLRRIRRSGDRTPVLVLTARGEEVDKVLGLRLGADDYVTKPFGLMELLARIEALLRRSGTAPQRAQLRFGAIEIDVDSRVVRRAGVPVELAPKEFALLLALHRHRGAAVSRVDLLAEVWGHSSAIVSRTVDTHVAELRRKLEANPARPTMIVTVPRVGYRLDVSDSAG